MANTDIQLAAIPGVDKLLKQSAIKSLIADYGRDLCRDVLRKEIVSLRQQMRAGEAVTEDIQRYLIERTQGALLALLTPGLRPVFNLTGTVLHTNLGRAPLPDEAIAAINLVASQATNLEYDLTLGRRGDRDNHVEDWLCRLTGAEAATVVNNNAAAVMLILNTLALAKQVPVSRGELVEIGGSFRMPDIMARAGCQLVEVGTTNRTHLKDFEQAINPQTALLLRVHTSNYQIQGFTHNVSEQALVALAQQYQIPLAHDLGSGSLLDLRFLGLGISDEPTPMNSIRNGVDLICFSGDKLLGGPQCGIIIGKKALIKQLKNNPMKRALRCDKVTLAALQAILPLYANPERVHEQIPALRLLTRSQQEIAKTAQRVLPVLQQHCAALAKLEIVDCASQIGSGALPVSQLASTAISLRPKAGAKKKSKILRPLVEAFRQLPKPILGRIQHDNLYFDLRCLEEKDEAEFSQQLVSHFQLPLP